jgi:hypothetical protein
MTLHGKKCECGSDLDPFGDHLLSCKKGNEVRARHDAIVGTFAHILQRAGIRAKVEQRLTQLGVVEDKPGQKMDLVYLDRQGNETCADPSIRHPTANSYLHGSAHTDGYTIKQAENAKNAKYKRKVEAAGCRFRPLIAETEGRWSEETARLLRELAKPAADAAENNGTFIRNRLVDAAWKQLSCTLQKFNGKLIIARCVAANNFRLPADIRARMQLTWGGRVQELFVPDWV